jgi:hypothetical protein
VSSTLNIFNGTDEELTDHEKVFFLVNNTGHVPWFQTLTSTYNNIDIRRTSLDFESVKSQYADEDVNHWMFHQKPVAPCQRSSEIHYRKMTSLYGSVINLIIYSLKDKYFLK